MSAMTPQQLTTPPQWVGALFAFIGVGTPGFFILGSDRYPCTVIAISKTGHRITVQQDEVQRWAPHPDCYGMEFRRNAAGRVTTFTRRRDGRYREQGANYGYLSLGGWSAYSDPHF